MDGLYVLVQAESCVLPLQSPANNKESTADSFLILNLSGNLHLIFDSHKNNKLSEVAAPLWPSIANILKFIIRCRSSGNRRIQLSYGPACLRNSVLIYESPRYCWLEKWKVTSLILLAISCKGHGCCWDNLIYQLAHSTSYATVTP